VDLLTVTSSLMPPPGTSLM